MYKLGNLILTHSGRLTDLRLCSVNYLTQRYAGDNRLLNLPPFEELPPASVFRGYNGALSFFHILIDAHNRWYARPFGSLRAGAKIQHAIQTSDRGLLVAYENYVEQWRFSIPIKKLEQINRDSYSVEKRIEHPHLPGLHTIHPLAGDRLVLSASAADAVLILNWQSGLIEQTLRMPPSLYGHNYELRPDMDLRLHYIANDYQTTHINSAYPMPGGYQIVVSALIQGAIGIFDLRDGTYRELTRGFVGCHGARANQAGVIYFADSVTGTLVFLDDDGRIMRRFGVNSRWLHDVQQIDGSVYAFTLADKNELHIYDIAYATLIHRQKFLTWPDHRLRCLRNRLPLWLGNSTQFLSFYHYGNGEI